MAFWPAWLIAPALAALSVGHWRVLRRPLGVSGVLARFARLREELARDRAAAALEAERAAVAAARAGDGDGATAEWPLLPPDVAGTSTGRTCAPTPPVAVHATFLVSLAVGGLVASLARGSFGAGLWGPMTAGAGAPSVAGLAVGGALVGFGASLSGGCTAGHGLTGCGRLMPGSVLATALYLGAAVLTSIVLGALG